MLLKLAVGNSFIIAHYKLQLSRLNLEVSLGMAVNNWVFNPKSWKNTHRNTNTNENDDLKQ